jgi:hypothetical protein
VPAVGAAGGREAGADGVVEDVVDGSREVLVRVDEPAGEAVAPQVARAGVLAVEALGVDAVEASEAVGESLAGAREDEVDVVRHQAERDHAPVLRCRDLSEEGQEGEVVPVVAEDGAAVDPAHGDVVDAVGEDAARDPGHGSDGTRDRARRPGLAAIRDALGTVDMAARAEKEGQSLVVAAVNAADPNTRPG